MSIKGKVQSLTKNLKPGTEIKELIDVLALEVGTVLEHQDKDIKWIRQNITINHKENKFPIYLSIASLFLSLLTLVVVIIWMV